MPRIECSAQLSSHCEVFWEGPAPDPDRAPICRDCRLLLLEAMTHD